MKKRRKIYALVIIIALFLHFIFSLISLVTVNKNKNLEFSSAEYEYDEKKFENYSSVQEIMEKIAQDNIYNELGYAFRITARENGSLDDEKQTLSSYIELGKPLAEELGRDRIDIEKYLNKKVMHKLRKAVYNTKYTDYINKGVSISKIEYSGEGGEIIPVNIYLVKFNEDNDAEPKKEYKVELCDKKITGTLYADKLAAFSSTNIKLYYFGNCSFVSYNKIYENRFEEKSLTVFDLLSLFFNYKDSLSSVDFKDNDGRNYFIFCERTYLPITTALRSGEFIKLFIINTVMFSAVAAISLVYIKKLFKNSEELSASVSEFVSNAEKELSAPNEEIAALCEKAKADISDADIIRQNAVLMNERLSKLLSFLRKNNKNHKFSTKKIKFVSDVSILILLCFAVSTSVVFFSVKSIKINNLKKFDPEPLSFFGKDFESEEEYMAFAEGYLSDVLDYGVPYRFKLATDGHSFMPECVIYVANPELYGKEFAAAAGGNYFSVEEYIDTATQKKIAELYEKYVYHKGEVELVSNHKSELGIIKLDYVIEDGKIRPINIYFNYFKGFKEEKIELSDSYLDYKTVYFDYGEGEEPLACFNFYRNDVYDFNDVIYYNIHAFPREMFFNGLLDIEPNSFYEHEYPKVKIAGEVYRSEIRFIVDENNFVLFSSEFAFAFLLQLAVYAPLYIASFFVSASFYGKFQKLSVSRMAFISGAAHEIKTPLAIIQNQSEFLLEGLAPEKNEEYISSILAEQKRIENLLSRLGEYSELNSFESVEKQELDAFELIKEESKKYFAAAKIKNVKISINGKSVTVLANRSLFALAVDNYISNALKNCNNNSVISVSLSDKDKYFSLSVLDEGELIEQKNASHIWEAFWRNDKSRKQQGGASGMGLAINKEIFDLHGYKYGFKNLKNGVIFYFGGKKR